MKPKQNDTNRNALNINILPPPRPIGGGKEDDIVSLGSIPTGNYGSILVKLMWRMINALHLGMRISPSDMSLLEDVLRYGSLTRIAELRRVDASTISQHFRRATLRFAEAVEDYEAQELQKQRVAQLEQRLAETEGRLRELLSAEPLTPEQRRERYLLMPVVELPVAKSLRNKLYSHGLRTVRDIVELPPGQLSTWFTPYGRNISQLADYIKDVTGANILASRPQGSVRDFVL